MSTDQDADPVAIYESFFLGTSAVYAVTALVFYEHLITFKDEIDFLIRRKWSTATWILVCNRYLMIADVLFLALPAIKPVCDNTRAMNFLVFLSSVMSVLPTHVFTVLRMFAILQPHPCRTLATCTLLALILTVFILNTYATFTGTWIYADDPVLGSSCFGTGYSVQASVINDLFTAASVINIIASALVLIVTLVKTGRQVRHASLLGLKTALSGVLLRDGSLFFLLILIEDLVNDIPALNGIVFGGSFGYAVTPVLDMLPSLLLSRFIINLRQVDSPATVGSSTNQSSSHFSVPRFRVPPMDDIVGNLGRPLEFGGDRPDDVDSVQDYDADEIANTDTEQQDAEGIRRATRMEELETGASSESGK